MRRARGVDKLPGSVGRSGPDISAGLRSGGTRGTIAKSVHTRPNRGFSLIDVLVSIAVIAVLISIMLPSLTTVKETANRVVCRSNVRQIGIGIALYAEDYRGQLPASIFVHDGDVDGPADPSELMSLRVQPAQGQGFAWDGLGLLYARDYLPAPLIFYCPSHHGTNAFEDYRYAWRSNEGIIMGNYHYRGVGPNGSTSLPRIQAQHPRAALLADGMRTLEDFNHRVGANVLRVDSSVDWFYDQSGRFAQLLPQREGDDSSSHSDQDTYNQAWGHLDQPGGGG